MSNTQVEESRELVKETKEREHITLKLETDGPSCCDSGVIKESQYSWDLIRAMSCWHWVDVSEASSKSIVAKASVVLELAWFTWALA